MPETVGDIRYLLVPRTEETPRGADARWSRGEAMQSPAECKRYLRALQERAGRKRYVPGSLLDDVQSSKWDWAQLKRTGPGRCGFVFTGERGPIQ